ncbi:unnamed protein product [Dibothriocephalus latus]|uniref:Uncharacterized protein n=1 Tax=Dibothriocephalus latus TaxID=60516 RepID=A0A3P7LSA8_DIBLA|nr:unnamed protein product [Dibothriocephalus latus]
MARDHIDTQKSKSCKNCCQPASRSIESLKETNHCSAVVGAKYELLTDKRVLKLTKEDNAFANFFEELADPHQVDGLSQNFPIGKCWQQNTLLTPDADAFNFFRGNPAAYNQVDEANNGLILMDSYGSISPLLQGPESAFAYGSRSQHTPPEAVSYARSFLESDRLDSSAPFCFTYNQPHRKPPKVVGGRYLLGETIGRGSYGKVSASTPLCIHPAIHVFSIASD